MKNLFILKSITEDNSISDEMFTVWCGLRNLMQKDTTEYFVSFNMIAYSLFNRVPTRYEINAIKVGYADLVDRGYIKVLDSYSSTEKLVDLTALYYNKEDGFFADLTDDEMHSVLNIPGNHNKYKLLRYFTCQIGSFNRSSDMGNLKGKIGGCTLKYFGRILSMSKTTLVSFNSILEDNQLLYIIRYNDFYQGSNAQGCSEIREIPNTYSRWSDRSLADEFASETHGYKFNTEENREKANRNRSLGQKLYWFINLHAEYDIETIKELYVYANEKNKKSKKYYEYNLEQGYKPEEPIYIDMSVFDDYLVDFA